MWQNAGPRLKCELATPVLARQNYARAGDIRGHQIDGELDSVEAQIEREPQRLDQRGLAGAGHAFDQHVTAGEQRRQQFLDRLLVTDDQLYESRPESAETSGRNPPPLAFPPVRRSSFEYPLDCSSIVSRHCGARDRLVRLLVQTEWSAHFGRHVRVTGALRAVIDRPRLDCDLESLAAELRGRRRAEQTVGIGADSMRLAAVAAVLTALLDAAITGAVVLVGVVLAGIGFDARLTGTAGRRLRIGLTRIVFARQIDLAGLRLILFELSRDFAVATFPRVRRATNFILILVASRIGQAQVEPLLRGRLLARQFVLQIAGHVARAIHQ